jgi:hypothetical protein
MGNKREKVALPARTVDCSDYVIDIDGTEYRPHEMECVSFRGGVTWVQVQRALRMKGLVGDNEGFDPTTLSQEQQDEFNLNFTEGVRDLAKAITGWTWTDPYTRTAYPSPPTFEVLANLDLRELNYLLEKQSTLAGPKEEPPSTSS